VFGYELLFRTSQENHFVASDAEQASLSVIANSFFVFGIGPLAGEARAFINFTRESLLSEYAYALPRDCLVVEILEDVPPDDDVVEACTRLKERGYTLALDDFNRREQTPDLEKLVRLADIVKIDFAIADESERAEYAWRFGQRGISLLAEKVETHEDAQQSRVSGYQYVQGYFYARPEILISQQAPAFRANRLQMLNELRREAPDLRKVEDLFRHDPDLSYKLLRHLNSGAFNFRSRITSIWRAIMILGERGMRAWTAVVVLAGLGSDHPSELVVTSVTRARFCELIGRELRLGDEQADDLFLLGLFSLIDALTGRPMEEALSALPLSTDAVDALLGRPNRKLHILQLVQLAERGRWAMVDQLVGSLRLSASRVAQLHNEAMQWGTMCRTLT
jgi:EAL and modified HD-GYP domain-containing signal transduction protein